MVIRICPICSQDNTEIRSVLEEIPVKGEPIKVDADVLFCLECQEEIGDPVLDERNLAKAYDTYRQVHGILSSRDMVEIREQYGLSQRSLAKLLGWGLITIHRYETGAIPSEAHNRILKSLRQPLTIKELIEEYPGRLSPTAQEQLLKKVNALLDASVSEQIVTYVQRVLEHRAPSEFTGYRKFDLFRFSNMALYFLNEIGPLFKTKLMKLLWYSDFQHFKANSVSISGVAYAHLPWGPVPDHHETLMAVLTEDKVLKIVPEGGPNWDGDKIIAQEKPDLAVFSAKELEILEAVAARLGHLSSKRVSDLSHVEAAWRRTIDGQLISYHLSTEMQLTL